MFFTLGANFNAMLALLGHLVAPLWLRVVAFLLLWGGFGLPRVSFGAKRPKNVKHDPTREPKWEHVE